MPPQTIPQTIPNHSWCVSCSTQCPSSKITKCARTRCNAKYCPKCVSNIHASYFDIPTTDGRIITSPDHSRPRCRYCYAYHRLEFFNIAKNVPINPTNITDLTKIRHDVRINRLHDELAGRPPTSNSPY